MSTLRDIIRNAAHAVGQKELLHAVQARMQGALRFATPSFPLHRNEDLAPFFVVGSGRCGTTLLRRLLQASPEVHIPPENWSMGGHVATFRRYRWVLSWTALVDLHLGRHVMESHRWFDEPPTELRDRLVHLPEKERSLARLLDEVYRYHGQCQDASFKRWGDKTPMNVGCMNEIADVFPKARFVHLLRDGMDVVHSYCNMEKHTDEVLAPARRWQRTVTTARWFGEKYPEQFLEIRYEDLCRESEETLRRVCSFLGLSFEDALLSRSDHYDEMETAQSVGHYENVFGAITTDSIGKGRENLNAVQKDQIRPILNGDLVRFGYASIES